MESCTNLLYKNAPYLTFPNLLVLKHDYLQVKIRCLTLFAKYMLRGVYMS